MIQVLREAARVRDQTYPREKMRFPHHGVLACVLDAGPLSQKEVGLRLRFDPSDLVTVIDELEAWGLVVRRRDPDDRRRQLVELTAAGRRAVQQHGAVVEEANDFLLAPLSATERKHFHAYLQRIHAHLVARQREPPR
jgi:DNA-binding MarR family transcriptional regulator